MKHKCMWPKILIMRFQLDSSQNRSADHAATFESTALILFFGDDGVTIYWSAGEFIAGEILCVHLLIISSFSSVFPLLPITMATGSSRKLGLSQERMNHKNVTIFLYFHTFGSVKQYIFPVNEETSSP